MTSDGRHKALVGIVMGSDSDFPMMSEAGKMLEKFGIAYEMEVLSAHRTPARAQRVRNHSGKPRTENRNCGGGSRSASRRRHGGKHHAAGDWCPHGHQHVKWPRCAARDGANASRDSRGDHGNRQGRSCKRSYFRRRGPGSIGFRDRQKTCRAQGRFGEIGCGKKRSPTETIVAKAVTAISSEAKFRNA